MGSDRDSSWRCRVSWERVRTRNEFRIETGSNLSRCEGERACGFMLRHWRGGFSPPVPKRPPHALLEISIVLWKSAYFLKSASSSKMRAGRVLGIWMVHLNRSRPGQRLLLLGKGRANRLSPLKHSEDTPAFSQRRERRRTLVYSFSLALH